MSKFLSCDWGTSSFRLRLVNADNLQVLAETTGAEGISSFFQTWSQSGRPAAERVRFFQSFLSTQIQTIEAQVKESLKTIPLVISGMASSRIGIIELPYQPLPIHTEGNDLLVKRIEATEIFDHPILLISGARTNDDIMRGEETQLIGCDINSRDEQIFIFPGTHSKHITVKNGYAVDCKTYMTGEFFGLLSGRSILAADVEEPGENEHEEFFMHFKKGVQDSLHSNILHSSFLVRSNHLLGKTRKKENYYYLSGLLIGTEVKELKDKKLPLVVVSSKKMADSYIAAFDVIGIANVIFQNAGEATIKGHYKIYTSTLNK